MTTDRASSGRDAPATTHPVSNEENSAWTWRDTAALTVVTVLAAAVRLVDLSHPARTIGDEGFYARDACWYVLSSEAICNVPNEITGEHPPLGKWLIAAGIRAFGYDAFGWRIAAAGAGVVTVALLYLLGRRVLRSTLGATIASGLLAVDFLHFVQSRIAMLDVFVTMFGVAAFLAWMYDYDRSISDRSDPPSSPWWRSRPWLLFAGIAAGGATATKWSGAFVWLALLALTLIPTLVRRDARGKQRDSAARRREAVLEGVFLIAVPVAVYLAAYVGRVHGDVLALPWREGSLARSWLGTQIKGMLLVHSGMEGVHPYTSPAWSWPLIRRPMHYIFLGSDSGFRTVFALGNPLAWWPGLLAVGFLAVRWIQGRVELRLALPVIGFASTWAPWLLLSRGREFVFIFYFLPAVPFLCLALGYFGARLARTRAGTAIVAAFMVGVAGLFLFFYPTLTARPLDREALDDRLWFRDCVDTMTIYEWRRKTDELTRLEAQGKTPTNADDLAPDHPPDGWCWM